MCRIWDKEHKNQCAWEVAGKSHFQVRLQMYIHSSRCHCSLSCSWRQGTVNSSQLDFHLYLRHTGHFEPFSSTQQSWLAANEMLHQVILRRTAENNTAEHLNQGKVHPLAGKQDTGMHLPCTWTGEGASEQRVLMEATTPPLNMRTMLEAPLHGQFSDHTAVHTLQPHFYNCIYPDVMNLTVELVNKIKATSAVKIQNCYQSCRLIILVTVHLQWHTIGELLNHPKHTF